jgi:hypothetical protein
MAGTCHRTKPVISETCSITLSGRATSERPLSRPKGDAIKAAAEMLNAGRATVANDEPRQILRQVSDLIGRHGDSRLNTRRRSISPASSLRDYARSSRKFLLGRPLVFDRNRRSVCARLSGAEDQHLDVLSFRHRQLPSLKTAFELHCCQPAPPRSGYRPPI